METYGWRAYLEASLGDHVHAHGVAGHADEAEEEVAAGQRGVDGLELAEGRGRLERRLHPTATRSSCERRARFMCTTAT